ncbi:uncharacterized protein I303_101509 [Kwoniella dejecticola CBS 10117]|uniref:Uncharacterized protein n=1 Tax=Kwoniella dejecticola CBS 10117 TaxID=1296121 RepID=A0A1A6ADM7_9TREE|nr:uncharacterized protein I303_02358 [Kwoniella dejecticola CBS 10117]OBR88138.1 hypothetical protein I303_02358 [Kwoniella dejecticola CBS 10117]
MSKFALTLAQTLAFFSALVSVTSHPVDDSQGSAIGRRDDGKVHSGVWIPENTKVIFKPSSSGEHFTYWGPQILENSWDLDTLKTLSPYTEYVGLNSTWSIYDASGKIETENLVWTLNCRNEVKSYIGASAVYQHKLTFNTTTIVTPGEDETWESLRDNSHFFCYAGTCENETCKDKPVPTWPISVYYENSATATSPRDDIRG